MKIWFDVAQGKGYWFAGDYMMCTSMYVDVGTGLFDSESGETEIVSPDTEEYERAFRGIFPSMSEDDAGDEELEEGDDTPRREPMANLRLAQDYPQQHEALAEPN
jgi:hypothetical protein